MRQYSLLIDRDLCFNCKACEVACKQEHDLPVGENWIKVVTIGPRLIGDRLVVDSYPVTCRHCTQAPCVTSCPTGAMTKNGMGVVLLEGKLCIGCMTCIEVCPFAAPQFNPEKNIVEKCNLCIHRLEKGLEPACVKHCESKAILSGEINALTGQLRERRSRRLAARDG